MIGHGFGTWPPAFAHGAGSPLTLEAKETILFRALILFYGLTYCFQESLGKAGVRGHETELQRKVVIEQLTERGWN